MSWACVEATGSSHPEWPRRSTPRSTMRSITLRAADRDGRRDPRAAFAADALVNLVTAWAAQGPGGEAHG